MECLHLTMTEVLKRQNSKSKKATIRWAGRKYRRKLRCGVNSPETNLVQTPSVTLMWFLQQCVAVDKQQPFLPRANILVFIYLFLSQFTRDGSCFYTLVFFSVCCTFIFTVSVVALWFSYTTHWLYLILFCCHWKIKYTVGDKFV